jgi:hypothetical protein
VGRENLIAGTDCGFAQEELNRRVHPSVMWAKLEAMDYDEVALFHDGTLLGVPMKPGLITHSPQGLHHGPPEKARERSRASFDTYDRLEWSVMSIDVRRPLTVNPALVDGSA